MCWDIGNYNFSEKRLKFHLFSLQLYFWLVCTLKKFWTNSPVEDTIFLLALWNSLIQYMILFRVASTAIKVTFFLLSTISGLDITVCGIPVYLLHRRPFFYNSLNMLQYVELYTKCSKNTQNKKLMQWNIITNNNKYELLVPLSLYY